MGLDMYLKGNKFLWNDWQNPDNNQKEDGFLIREKVLELGCWRKHPDLHGYIVNTFADGKDEYQEIILDVERMESIIAAIKNKELPHTTGFFFGSSGDSKDAESIATFEKAIKWAKHEEKGVSRSVIYQASW